MAEERTQLVFGTSGHIDHGKSTLVQALTGTNTDRLAEEQVRGISIDLGFAHCDDAMGHLLSFVDVPGHEHFVHNMLSGAAGIDAVLMVVAADEGIMPQTLEHLHICELLGIPQGVVVVSRADLATKKMLQQREGEVRTAFAHSFLRDAPIQVVSARSGEGLESLRELLSACVQNRRQHDLRQPFRMAIDRSFSLKGFGTVATGTVLSGIFDVKQTAWLYPPGISLRARGLHTHGQAVERVKAGERAAFNVAGISKGELHRGDQLAAEGSMLSSSILNAQAQLLESVEKPLTPRARVRVHLHAKEVMARVIPLESPRWHPGKSQYIQLRLEKPLYARFGDRFVIRCYSPVATIGGGLIIEPAALKISSAAVASSLIPRLQQLHQGTSAQRLAAASLGRPLGLLPQTQAGALTNLTPKDLAPLFKQLQQTNTLLPFETPSGTHWLHRHFFQQLSSLLKQILAQFHHQHPQRNGMTVGELAGKMPPQLQVTGTQAILQQLLSQRELTQHQDSFQLPQHQASLPPQKALQLQQLLNTIRSNPTQPPRLNLLITNTNLSPKQAQALLAVAIEAKQLVRIKQDLYYLPDTLQAIQQKLLAHLQQQQRINVIEFKSLANLSRKHAVDLLEYFDDQRITLRIENHRILRSPQHST